MVADGALCFHKKFQTAAMAMRTAARGYVIWGTIQGPRQCWHCNDFRLFPESEKYEEELKRLSTPLAEAGCLERATFEDESHAEKHRKKSSERYGKPMFRWKCATCGLFHIGDETQAPPEIVHPLKAA